MPSEERTARLSVLIDPKKKACFEALCKQDDVTPSQAGLIQSVSQAPWLWLPAWVEVGGIALFLCPKPLFPQPIST